MLVFREVLEAALVIIIVMAATRGVFGCGLWVTSGAALGVAGAVVMAVFANTIADAAKGAGQELANAAILFAAVAMLEIGRASCRENVCLSEESSVDVGN